MNRRSFFLHGVAGIALLGTGAAAQRGSTSASVIISQVTGAEIDFTESGFSLEHQEINAFFSSQGVLCENEHIHFVTEGGKLEIELLASGIFNWQEDMSNFLASVRVEGANRACGLATGRHPGFTRAIVFERSWGNGADR